MRTWTVPGYTEIGSDPAAGHTRLATHTATGARVTIRYLPDEDHHDEVRLAGHRDEARRRAELDSPYVVGLYEYVEAVDGTALVREHVDGVPLATLLTGRGLRPEAALTVLNGVLRGLAATEAGGVRCAYTVLIGRSGQVKLAEDGPLDGVPGAYATFLHCLRGTKSGRDKLPRPLRRLAPPAAAGDGAALLAELIAAAATYGADWENTGRRHLVRSLARSAVRTKRPD